MDETERWTRCLAELLGRVDDDDRVGLSTLTLTAISPQRAVLGGVADSFWRGRIRRRFLPLLQALLAAHFAELGLPPAVPIELRIGPAVPLPERDARRPRAASRATPRDPAQMSLPMDADGGDGLTGLDPRLCFDTFQESAANRSALAFARAVSETPGARYNPLVLIGEPGHGKTHLLHAIANAYLARPMPRVVCTTAEDFANALWEGIRLKRMNTVRARFRQADALLLDSVEFLGVSPRAQEELVHTIDAVRARGGQLVFTVDRFPSGLTSFSAALRSRLEMGLTAEVGPLDARTRLALVRARAEADGIALDEETMSLLAERITGSARKLEGAVVRIGAYAALTEQAITPAFAASLLAPLFDAAPLARPAVSPREIIARVCEHTGVKPDALRSRGRAGQVVRARRIVVYLLRRAAGLSYGEIGLLLGNRSHSTVIQAERGLQADLTREPMLRQFLERLLAEWQG
jgi:chromosomal replication initiator protein